MTCVWSLRDIDGFGIGSVDTSNTQLATTINYRDIAISTLYSYDKIFHSTEWNLPGMHESFCMPELCATELLSQSIQLTTKAHLLRNTGLQHNKNETQLKWIWLTFEVPVASDVLLAMSVVSGFTASWNKERKKLQNKFSLYNVHQSSMCTIRHWIFYPIIIHIKTLNWDSFANTDTGYRLGFVSWQEQDSFLFSTASRQALRPNQPPIQWLPGVLKRIKLVQLGWNPIGSTQHYGH
jgi:hypothetical protein